MKSTKVQTLGAVGLHAQLQQLEASSPLNWASDGPAVRALTRDHYRTTLRTWNGEVYKTLQREQNGGLELAWSRYIYN